MIRSKLGLVLLMAVGLATLTGPFRSQRTKPSRVERPGLAGGAWSGEKNGTLTEEHCWPPKGPDARNEPNQPGPGQKLL